MRYVWVLLLNIFLGCQVFQTKEVSDPEDTVVSEMTEKVSMLLSEDLASEVWEVEDKSQLNYEVKRFVGHKLITIKVTDTSKEADYVLEITVKTKDGMNRSVEKIVIKENDAERLIKKMEVALRQIL